MQVQKETEFVKIPLNLRTANLCKDHVVEIRSLVFFLFIYFRIVLKPTCIPWTELGLDMFSV